MPCRSFLVYILYQPIILCLIIAQASNIRHDDKLSVGQISCVEPAAYTQSKFLCFGPGARVPFSEFIFESNGVVLSVVDMIILLFFQAYGGAH